MNQEQILTWAREAGALVFHSNFCNSSFDFNSEQLERFTAIVAKHEREKEIKRVAEGHGWTQEHWTQYEHAIAAAEREACAKVCDDIDQRDDIHPDHVAIECAEAIRARGEK